MIRRVLFVCTVNSARSQMAEALLPLIAGDRFEARSAGTNPVDLNPYAVTAMREVGVEIIRQRSKHFSEFVGQHFDYVIPVCDQARETCPVFSGAEHVRHWSFEDPAAAPEPERLAVFCKIRDDIADAICLFLAEEEELFPGDLNCYRCR
jgi:arsenate reductase